MALNDAFTLQALANSSYFRQRVKNALGKIAWQVLGQPTGDGTNGTATAISKNYARAVLSNLDQYASLTAGWIVTRTNLISTNITASLDKGLTVVDSDAADAAIESQLATDWSSIAGG